MLLAAAFALASARAAALVPQSTVETHRIRITNAAGGLVEVSADRGRSWVCVGRVLRPAHSLARGFAASRWAKDGAVAAVAVHGIRVRVGPTEDGERGALFSVVPKEFSHLPSGYGGHIPGASGIYTDIPAGTSIFRNLAPFVGNPVFVQYKDQLVRVDGDYLPLPEDRIVIVVRRPRIMPTSIEFENRAGGLVTLRHGAASEVIIARVKRPVRGVGRFDATGYTGIGCINTNHAGVITISTAPDVNGNGELVPNSGETRGGFMIQPNRHAEEEGYPVFQVMVVEPPSADSSPLEGQPPLFSGYLSLQFQSRDPERSFVCQMRVDGGPWEQLPAYVGVNSRLFTAAGLTSYFRKQGSARVAREGVTHLRILFPKLTYEAQAAACWALCRWLCLAGARFGCGGYTCSTILS